MNWHGEVAALISKRILCHGQRIEPTSLRVQVRTSVHVRELVLLVLLVNNVSFVVLFSLSIVPCVPRS